MTIAKPSYSVAVESAKAILDAARPAAAPSPEAIEATRRWLELILARAIKRADPNRIVMKDVDRLEKAFSTFQTVIESLQDRDNPPPRIPVTDGTNDWDHWLIEYRHFGFKRGRRASADWKLIGSLLALYEVTSGRRASAAQPAGPTMKFLDKALSELATHSPTGALSCFKLPKADALKQQLSRRRRLDIAREAKKLSEAIEREKGE